MGLPIVAAAVAAGVQVISGVVQYYHAEKARNAEQDRLDQIQAIFEKIKPPNYDMDINDPPELHENMLSLPQFSSPAAAPQFNLQALDLQDLEVIEQFSPEVAQMVVEEEPTIIERTPDMDLGRQAQLDALDRYAQIAEGDFDPEYQQAVQEASLQAGADARSRSRSVMQDFQRRGAGGSGLEFLSTLQSGAEASDRQAMTNLAAASEAYRNRLDAMARGADLGQDIFTQDRNVQQTNAGIINDFNQRMSSRRWEQEKLAADTRNEAEKLNLSLKQDIANQNVINDNNQMISERQRADDLAKWRYNQDIEERQRQDELSKWNYNASSDQNAYNNAIRASTAAWQAAEKDRINDLKSRQYDDSLRKAGASSGILRERTDSDIRHTQDRNNAIQGVANMGSLAAMYGMDKEKGAYMAPAFQNQGGSYNNGQQAPAQKYYPTRYDDEEYYP